MANDSGSTGGCSLIFFQNTSAWVQIFYVFIYIISVGVVFLFLREAQLPTPMAVRTEYCFFLLREED